MKKGFGLLEVLIAAVVLGFLIVGLNNLQKGNREAVLRVRARDAANIIAQHVLDSLGALGINSLVAENNHIIYNAPYIYNFEGNPQLNKNSAGIRSEVTYTVNVDILDYGDGKTVDSTSFTIAERSNGVISESERNTYAKTLEATVSWNFKQSTQSIKVAKVVR